MDCEYELGEYGRLGKWLKGEKPASISNSRLIGGLCCEDCGEKYSRPATYLEQKRNDPLFKWKKLKCDACVKKRVNKALDNMPKVLAGLAT